MKKLVTSSLLFRNAHLYAADREISRGWLLVEDGKIALLGAGDAPNFPAGRVGESVDAAGLNLLPGFIDLHTHGAMGAEVMDADPDAIRTLARFAARHGVTAFLPTTWTAAPRDILAALGAVRQVMGAVEGGATVLGAHLEGPFLNPTRTGAQDARLIRRATPEEALPYLESGAVRLLTLAPEFPENLWLVDACVQREITVSAGHTVAGLAELQEAARRGLTHITHCYNAMPGLGHREVGTVGAAMVMPELRCELIADNIHVHPAAQKILIEVKTPAGVVLVTDALRGAGMPEGEYRIDARTITVRDGVARLPDGTIAGSVLTMNRALQNALAASGYSLGEGWMMSSLNAARQIGVAARKGSLEAGKDADLALLDADFNVRMTVAEGRVVYRT